MRDASAPIVSAAPGFLGTAFARAVAVVVVAWTATVVVGTPAFDAVRPRAAPSPVGREKAADDARRAAANLADGSAAKIFEADLRARSTVRAAAAPYYAAPLARWLGGGETERLLVGRDGWLFLSHRAFPWTDDPDRAARFPASLVAALSKRLGSQGVSLTVALIPRTVDVAADRLYSRADRVGPGLYDAAMGELREGGVNAPDLLARFRSTGAPQAAYLRTDSHWSPYGTMLAAESVAQALGDSPAESARDTRIGSRGPTEVAGDLAKIVGFVREDGTSLSAFRETTEDFEVRAVHGNARIVRKNYWTFGDDLLVGTSFSRQEGRFPSYLRHFTGVEWGVAAINGLGPVVPLKKVVSEAAARGWPRRMIWEVAAHELFSVRGFPDDVGDVVARIPTRGFAAIPGGEALSSAILEGLKSGGRLETGRSAAVEIAKDRLVCTGDGVVSLRLRGRPSNGAYVVTIRGRGGEFDVEWPLGASELVLPICDVGTFHGGRISLRPKAGSAKLRLDDAELVAPFGSAAELGDGPAYALVVVPSGAHGSPAPFAVRTVWTERGRATTREAEFSASAAGNLIVVAAPSCSSVPTAVEVLGAGAERLVVKSYVLRPSDGASAAGSRPTVRPVDSAPASRTDGRASRPAKNAKK